MKTKNIFKALALAMLMPAMMLTTACSNEDDAINNGDNKKGYPLQVTVNVTRQGDKATTRATYTDNGDGTGSLGFSAGDKLFVKGHASGTAGQFAGTLTMVSAGTFSGTIYTENSYSGTADALLAEAGMARATLLPDGYETPGFLSISGSGATASISRDASKAFATSKAAAVEQFSYEMSTTYFSGFALSPANVILNFTITGLAASTEVTASFTDDYSNVISGNVTTDGSGNATFAIGVAGNTNLKNCSLTVGGNAITLTSSDKYLTEGKIYNISRNLILANATTSDIGKVIGANGKIYADAAAAVADGTTALALIAYVGAAGSADASSAMYKGLALALTDASTGVVTWCSQRDATCLATQYGNVTAAKTDMAGIANTNALVGHGSHTHTAASAARNYNSGTHPTGTSAWFLPSAGQWDKMATAAGSYATLKSNASLKSALYWSSTEGDVQYAWYYTFYGDAGYWGDGFKTQSYYARACLAF
jgi:hypothetical protein